MRVLELNDEARARVMRVRRHAEQPENFYHLAGPVPGDDPHFICHLNSYRCVFTISVAFDGFHYRHLSISVPSAKYPNPFAAWTIAELFGFTGWDGLNYQRVPSDWQVHVSREEHSVVMAQLMRKEQIN
jgi:hypothetical protein